MRCTNCGFPLSPTSTSGVCPRCHMAVATGGKGRNGAAEQQQTTWGSGSVVSGWQEQSGPMVGTPPNSTLPPGSTYANSMPHHTPYPQPGQLWFPTPPATPVPAPGDVGAEYGTGGTGEMRQETRPLRPTPSIYAQKRRGMCKADSNLGFVIAGLCVLTGGLLLIVVYFLAAGLSPATVQTTSTMTGNAVTTSMGHHTPTATAQGTQQPTATATTQAFPGQQYISNPQMASAVNTNTAQVITTATTFKVGQKVYVTFNIHPNGQSGAICLQWYTNARAFSHYEFAVSSESSVAYSYTYYAVAGSGYVEIYWASNVSCNDELLAQRVNFTVVS